MTRTGLVSLLLLSAGTAAAQSPTAFLPREPVRESPPVAAPEPTPQPVVIPVGAGPSFRLDSIRLEGATAVAEADLAPIWAPFLGQPVTLATLEGIAEAISAAYRARGLILSQAMLPEQTVADGEVRILVVEGFIDDVALDGGAPNQRAYAGRLFAAVAADRPLALPTLERAVLLARDTFGEVETVIAPSPATFGAADLTVLIAPAPLAGFATIDNRGSRLYGAVTATGGVSLVNRLGLNERIDVVAATAVDGSLAYGAGYLELPLTALAGSVLDGARLELGASRSTSDPDLAESGSPEDLAMTVDETDLTAAIAVPFIRTRSQTLSARLGLEWQDSVTETGFGSDQTVSDDRLLVLEARLTWDIADRFGGVSLFDAALRQGLDTDRAEIGDSGPAAGVPDFTAFILTLSRLQRLGAGPWSLYAEAIGQYAADVLPNSERFALGDASIGRGYAPGNTTGDSGYGARLELRRQFAGREGLLAAAEGYAFADYGQAYDRVAERDADSWETLASAGIGARLDLRPWLTLTPEIARQLHGVATDTTRTGLETRAYIGLVARF